MDEIIVGIDIGTSKVCTLIGQMNKVNQVEVLGRGMAFCTGVKKGIIVDIDSTSKSIKASVEQAEAMSNMKIGSAYVNIMGTHVLVKNNRNFVNVSNENREITIKDVERVLNSVRDVSIPEDRQLIDVIPRQFIIDGYDEIIDPVGMVGVRLEVDADVVVGKITSVQNIVKSMERANLKIDGFVVEVFATREVVLTPEEEEMGVILVDVGGGITEVSVFKGKKMVFYDSIPVGGDHITNDISLGLKISYSDAEKLKRQYELALTSLIKNDQEVWVNEVNENKRKSIKVSELVEIIEARVFEIFSLCKELIDKANTYENYVAGVVLSGCGITFVDGAKQLTEEVFGLAARNSSFKLVGVSKQEYTTAAGIIKYVAGNRKSNNLGSEVKVIRQKNTANKAGFIRKLSKLFNDFFFIL